MRARGQADPWGVGGLVALLVLIAIGALVTYEVTGALDATNPATTITLTDESSTSTTATLTVSDSIQSATLTSTLNTDNEVEDSGTTTIMVQLAGENIIVAVDDNISSENTVTTTAVVGANTISIICDNENVYWTGTVTLDVTTYVSSAVGETEEKGSTVFSLLSILAIVIVAALIIGVVIRSIGGGIGRGER